MRRSPMLLSNSKSASARYHAKLKTSVASGATTIYSANRAERARPFAVARRPADRGRVARDRVIRSGERLSCPQNRVARFSTHSMPAIRCCMARSTTTLRNNAGRSGGSSPAGRVCPMSCRMRRCPPRSVWEYRTWRRRPLSGADSLRRYTLPLIAAAALQLRG